MKRLLIGVAGCLFAAHVAAQSPIECTFADKKGLTLWPPIYLSGAQLCFNVKGWPEYRGQNCVGDGGTIEWHGLVIVMVGDESKGRDDYDFRVRKPKVTNELLSYTIEYRRGGGWQPMQSIEIDRMTGRGVSRLLDTHGGDALTCGRRQKKL